MWHGSWLIRAFPILSASWKHWEHSLPTSCGWVLVTWGDFVFPNTFLKIFCTQCWANVGSDVGHNKPDLQSCLLVMCCWKGNGGAQCNGWWVEVIWKINCAGAVVDEWISIIQKNTWRHLYKMCKRCSTGTGFRHQWGEKWATGKWNLEICFKKMSSSFVSLYGWEPPSSSPDSCSLWEVEMLLGI